MHRRVIGRGPAAAVLAGLISPPRHRARRPPGQARAGSVTRISRRPATAATTSATTGSTLRTRRRAAGCSGVATIEATAKQALSSFNLDLDGLKVRSVKVAGARARFRRSGGELTIVPRTSLRPGRRFRTVIAYDGVPKSNGQTGVIPTSDGVLIAGEPDGAATWFPVNDHPSDTAAYSFAITVPRGLEAIANGELVGVDAPRCAHDVEVGGPRADGAVPRDGVDRAVRPARLRGRRDQVLGRDRPRPDDRAEAAHRCALRAERRRPAGVQAAHTDARGARERRRRCRSACTATPSRWPTSSWSRRARPAVRTGPPCPTRRGTTSASPATTATRR